MNTITLTLSLGLLYLSAAAQPTNDQVRWPKDYEPSMSSFFVHNEIDIAAPASRVWSLLIEAEEWPNWYEGAHEVSIADSEQSVLQANTVFIWKTMGLHFESTINEFDAPYRLSWESKKKSIQGYHGWIIIPTAGGCRVITEESQNGWLTFFEKTFQGKKLKRLHDVWLLQLKKKAENNS